MLINPWWTRLLPVGAIMREDLRQTLRHWAFIAWAVLSILVTILGFASASGDAATGAMTTAHFAARLLTYHILLWAGFAIALGASSLPSESHLLGDAILCRGISRWHYFVGKCAARTSAVLILFGLLTVPAIALAAVRFPNDIAWSGVGVSLFLVGTLMAGLTLVSASAGVWFRSPLMSVAAALMVLYGFGIVVTSLEIESLSPLVLAYHLPEILRGSTEALASHHLVPTLLIGAGVSLLGSLMCFAQKDV
ncbi:hypothetical protein [Planctomycetes bacterium Pan216]|uniref:hypothetical protein n=1 Tax=Kolteria novifilia TaxID=2527975 RepID=UPI0011AB24F8